MSQNHKKRKEALQEGSARPTLKQTSVAHLSPQERAAVLAQWEREERDTVSQQNEPTVQDLAEGLEIPPERVNALLAKVRARKAATRTLLRDRARYALVPVAIAALAVLYFKGIVPHRAAAAAAEHAERAQKLEEKSRFLPAEDEYREAIRLEPDNLPYRTALADMLYTRGSWPQVEEEYRQILKAAPAKALYEKRLGDALYNQKRYPASEAEYRKAVQMEPRKALYQDNLGDALYKQNRDKEAEELYRQAVQLEPDDSIYAADLGNTLLRQKRYAEAEKSYRDSLKLDSNNAVVHNNLGLTLIQLGKYVLAQPEFEASIRIDPQDGDYYANLASALFWQGKHYKEALEAGKTAIRHGCKENNIYVFLGLDPNKPQ